MLSVEKLILIPSFISSLRIAALPLFFYFFNRSDVISCLIILAFSAATDFFDGYIARKLIVSSRFGAYYDAITDFTLTMGIFVVFSASGYYSIWLLILIAASVVQVLATSRYAKKLYDPVGRYFGSALYIGIALTLIWPTEAIFIFVQYAFVGFFVVSIASRIVSLTRKRA